MPEKNIAADVKIDCSGLYCPQPVINAQKAIETMRAGQILEISATDPGVTSDFPLFCKSRKLKLLRIDEMSGEFIIFIQK
ncbi:MAG TPA: sulfurtransferase TusA family protein [Candidatus Wallbacteria bacterium]|nr:sulfurtransferase TusA family protein [Candidatus Wallbacteria bacterium]